MEPDPTVSDPTVEAHGVAAVRAVRAALELRDLRTHDIELALERWSIALPRMDQRIERALRQAFEASYGGQRWARQVILIIVLPQRLPPG